MHYEGMREGHFLARPNRFLARVELDGREETVHVKNTGRCRELLVPGARVWLEPSRTPGRKTAYSLIAVEKGGRIINMDSQAPNAAAGEWIAAGGLGGVPDLLRPEAHLGASRLDFYAEIGPRRIWVEVKGVTLEEDGHVRFPDAPTQRGARHIRELIAAVEAGYEAWALFVIQMEGVTDFAPNDATDPDFAAALRDAHAAGVHVCAVDCTVTPDAMAVRGPVPVRLG